MKGASISFKGNTCLPFYFMSAWPLISMEMHSFYTDKSFHFLTFDNSYFLEFVLLRLEPTNTNRLKALLEFWGLSERDCLFIFAILFHWATTLSHLNQIQPWLSSIRNTCFYLTKNGSYKSGLKWCNLITGQLLCSHAGAARNTISIFQFVCFTGLKFNTDFSK